MPQLSGAFVEQSGGQSGILPLCDVMWPSGGKIKASEASRPSGAPRGEEKLGTKINSRVSVGLCIHSLTEDNTKRLFQVTKWLGFIQETSASFNEP